MERSARPLFKKEGDGIREEGARRDGRLPARKHGESLNIQKAPRDDGRTQRKRAAREIGRRRRGDVDYGDSIWATSPRCSNKRLGFYVTHYKVFEEG